MGQRCCLLCGCVLQVKFFLILILPAGCLTSQRYHYQISTMPSSFCLNWVQLPLFCCGTSRQSQSSLAVQVSSSILYLPQDARPLKYFRLVPSCFLYVLSLFLMRSIPKSSAEITFLECSLQFPHTSMLLPNNQLLHSRWLFFVSSLGSVRASLPVCLAALYQLI